MFKHWKEGLKNCFEMFKTVLAVILRIITDPMKLIETLSAEILIILRKSQYWRRFQVPNKKTCI